MIKKHIDVLDGLRGLAALLVVLTHASGRGLIDFYNTSTAGVAIFFCLSGFLMGFLYLGKPVSRASLTRYAISRFSRIAPAYLTVIIFSYFIFNYVDHNFIYAIENHNVLRHLLFSGNVSVFWSIPPEVQFYAFFILIWYAFSAYITEAKYLPIALLTLIIFLLILGRNHFPGTFVGSKLHFFVFGCIAGQLRQRVDISEKHKFLPLVQVGIFSFMLVLGIYLVAIHDYKYPYEIIYYAIVTAIAIFVMSYETSTMRFILGNKPLMLLGKWSFSLYLTHEIILQIVERAFTAQWLSQSQALFLAFSGSILLSWLMFELIEKTTQNFLKNFLTNLNGTSSKGK